MPAELAAHRRALALTVVALAMLAPLSALGAAVPARAESTSSAATVSARDYDADAGNSPFPELKVTVSQTQDLIQQGVTVSWTGGKQSSVPNAQIGGSNFLQIAQCWGDEPGSNGTRPDRTTCQYGGLNVPADSRWSPRSSSAEVDAQDTPFTAKGEDWSEPDQTAIPFMSHTGVTVASVVDGKKVKDAPDLNTNQFFTKFTTNEVAWAGSGADGSGSINFELQTLQQSPGLGCGSPVTANGSTTGSACWLVVIPRGVADPGRSSVTQSGLFWGTWTHHVAIRLKFKAAGLSCDIGAAERQLSGSELISAAMGQWQPALCSGSDGAVYSLLTGPESDAALAANGTASAPMALTSRAMAADGVTDHLAYAPIALTGVSIAFAIDRQANVTGETVPDSIAAKERQAFESLKLTPRLLAKLLTASYSDALPSGAAHPHVTGARNVTQDPDFLAINSDEWRYMRIVGPGVGDALAPLGRSDAARTIWTYIMADPDARAFLAGKADPWGMKVNPYYSTNAKVNPGGSALTLPRDDFPKADPIEFKGHANHDYADVVNLVTWRPFSTSLDAGGYLVLRGDAQVLGDWDASAIPPKYGKAARALVGLQSVIGLTDTSAAAKYQVIQASLLNPAGAYVAPTSASLAAASTAMTGNSKQKQVVEFVLSSTAARRATKAYPLAMPVYAAVNPAMEDAALRANYAAFIKYAVGKGQTPGTDDGELPAGYAPLPASWKKVALTAAAAIKSGSMTTATTSPSPTATSTTTSSGTTGSTTPSTSQPDPAAGGTPAGALAGSSTQADPGLGGLVGVVPTAAGVGLAAALGVPLLSRFRRRQS